MKILLNGEERDAPPGLTVADLLNWLGVDARLVAVELNRTVVKRARYAETPVTENAEVEIVAFVGGGHRTTRSAAPTAPPPWPTTRRHTQSGRRSRCPQTG